jgi:serine/threonine protein kinase/formylglycine-generating enzyme required for sulfatase activity
MADDSDDDDRDENDERRSTPSTESGDEPPVEESVQTPPGSFPPLTFDNFRIIKFLGQGGMGRVYLAQDIPIGRHVAIKFIREPGDVQRERFLKEAQAAGKLDHSNIVKIYHFGEIEGQPYIVAEYVPGKSLGARDKPIPWQEALMLGIGLARGLAEAHRRGVLHRDIKPSNVIIAESGQPKLLDFGLAKLQDTSDADARPEGAQQPPSPPAPGTETGALLGTPYYMAPEAWRGQASYAADVYSLGVLLYELCTGRVPFHDVLREELSRRVQGQDAPPLENDAPDVPPAFAAVIDRCLARDPAARYANGERLLVALSGLDLPAQFWTSDPSNAAAPELAQGSPYPGLRPFDADDRGFFFGREEDIRRVLERLRRPSMVLVAGASGVGKSSLVRAGVLPHLAARGLGESSQCGESRGWKIRSWLPGAHPLQAMSAALRGDVDMDEEALASELTHEPEAVGHRLQGKLRTDMVLFVDQLEELVTVADAEEAGVVSRALATLAARFPRIHVLATVRGDKIIDVAGLPGLDAQVEPALYVLQPLGEAQVGEAVVRPAARYGVRFESDALVRTLVSDTIREAGGLPLLQSALALLWERRDQTRGIIPDAALADIGGVAGALARHADRVLDGLLPENRMAARTLLLRLVTLRGSRVRHTEDDLLAGGAAHAAALAALVAGRLLVAREIDGQAVYEIAHEALIDAWPTLHGWVSEEDRLLRVRQLLAAAAEEWERQSRAREALWQARRLREAEDLDVETLVPREQAFLRESHRLARRIRRRRQLAVALVVGLIAAIYGWFRIADALAIRDYLRQAEVVLAEARALEDGYRHLRREALAAYADVDGTRPGADEELLQRGESRWQRVVGLAPEIDRKLVEASRPLELALLLDPSHPEVHRLLGMTLYSRALLAEDQGHTGELSVLRERLAGYDPQLAARWQRPGRVTVQTSPAGLEVALYEYEASAEGALAMIPRTDVPKSPGSWRLPPGSYVAVIRAQGDRAEVRYPFWLAPGRNLEADPVSLHITVPLAREVPPGMIYVPAGWFWFGFGGDEIREPIRAWQLAPPPHQRWTDAFFIARHETTFGQWVEFLRALPADQRKARVPQAEFNGMQVELAESAGELFFRYRFESDQELHEVRMGERMVYASRDRNREQDWLRFPVTGIDGEDAMAYARWLSEQHAVPGARLCREDEWERAARGADLRMYPHGDRLAQDDANIDLTYGRRSDTIGFDEVGLHVPSRSPFGLDDMIGNAREMTISILEPGTLIQRSGAFFHEPRTNPITNREAMLMRQRTPFVGFRICAQPPPHLRGSR